MKSLLFLSAISGLLLSFIFGCTGTVRQKQVENPVLSDTIKMNMAADKILGWIQRDSLENISVYIHPQKGIFIAPMVRIETYSTHFSADQIKNIRSNKEKYFWGFSDGSGDSIKLDVSEFRKKFWMNRDYSKGVKKMSRHPVHFTNTKENIQEFFHQAILVDYIVNPNEDMDWGSLILVFTKDSGRYYLSAILSNYWTI